MKNGERADGGTRLVLPQRRLKTARNLCLARVSLTYTHNSRSDLAPTQQQRNEFRVYTNVFPWCFNLAYSVKRVSPAFFLSLLRFLLTFFPLIFPFIYRLIKVIKMCPITSNSFLALAILCMLGLIPKSRGQ